MHDSRERLKRFYSYMSPEEWQAAQPKPMKSEEGEGPPAKRQRTARYTAEDFQTPYASRDEVKKWYREFPALGKRNFYIVHNHWATAKHHDLRIQLDGETISWAIPRGLTNPAGQTTRYAIETIPHSIAYSLYEGPTVQSIKKPTGVWDIGTYTIHETKRSSNKKARIRAQGLNDAETTDEDETLEDEEVKQERLFREGYYYASFRPVPATADRPALPARPDDGHRRAFVIELHGKRWRGLRLMFARKASEFNYTKPKGAPEDFRSLERHAHWFVILSSASMPLAATESRTIPADRSILTNRTMEEIRSDSAALLDMLRGTSDSNQRIDRKVVTMLRKMIEEDRGDDFTQEDLRYLANEADAAKEEEEEADTP